LPLAGEVGGRISLSEREMGELLTLLRELNQKTERMRDEIVELRVTSTADSGRLRETIAERFDRLFDTYKGFSGTIDRVDRRLGSSVCMSKS
jgi:hypothetical protein